MSVRAAFLKNAEKTRKDSEMQCLSFLSKFLVFETLI